MNGSFAFPGRVPASAVERMERNLAGLLGAIVAALAAAEPGNLLAGRWQRAYDQLATEQAQLADEVKAFEAGDRLPLLRHAVNLRLLTRNLDGSSPDFAGAEAGKAIALHQQLLVFTAWQVAAVASGVEGAGI